MENDVLELLQRVPQTWTHCDFDSFTADEEKALFLIKSAGLIETRLTLRASVLTEGNVTSYLLKVECAGPAGFSQAIDPLIDKIWREYKGGPRPRLVMERQEEEWRLTDHGIRAIKDVTTGNGAMVADFVCRGTVYALRPVVDSKGQLVSIRIEPPTEPFPVNVKNWAEGADAIKAKLAELPFAKADPGSAKTSQKEEWLPASQAIEWAAKKGYDITMKWITVDAPKKGLKIRESQFPPAKKDVELGSLAMLLVDLPKSNIDEDGDEPDEEIQQSIAAARAKKQRDLR